VEPLADVGFVDDAEVVVVAFGTPGKYVRHVVRTLRAEGVPVGYARPITLFPFPSAAVAAAGAGARRMLVFENNEGQMIDDVRLSVLGATPVEFIGGLSFDTSGFGIGPDIDVAVIRNRIEEAW
jgi:2-oxoglutarate ferredoxin oxidoreductase subunit alpha